MPAPKKPAKSSRTSAAETERVALEVHLMMEALHFTEDVPHDIPVPSGAGSVFITGYLPSKGRDVLGVSEACTTSNSHSVNRNDKTTSQQGTPCTPHEC